jgi:hypothetical protein
MRILDLFSKRQKKLRGEMPDVYMYDELPQPLKVQIVHMSLMRPVRFHENDELRE